MNIWIAAADNNEAAVKNFVEVQKVDPNAKDSNGYTPIHAAASYNHPDLLKYLINNGGDVNVKDNDGDTPLHVVESAEAARLLLALGADSNLVNLEGKTPLMKLEAEDEYPEIIAILRESAGQSTASLPENMTISTSFESSINNGHFEGATISEDYRSRLDEIIRNGSQEGFEEFLKNSIRSGLDLRSEKKFEHTNKK